MSEQSKSVMLPKIINPLLYELILKPDLEQFTFCGKETVQIDVLSTTSIIVLNCAEIEIDICSLTNPSGTTITPMETIISEEDETVAFHFGQQIPEGISKLHIEFRGKLNDLLRGFYRSRYVDSEGSEKYLASTQFEATDARRAFPCWDEPSLKAKFLLTLVIPSGLVAISNTMTTEQVECQDGLRRITFGETPLMSTYLLAFVIGDIESIEKRAPDGTLVRVWATSGKQYQGHFALELSVKLLDYFNNYFGVAYPLEKLDHIAIPEFAAGAMENWGAITYRENALLVDPEKSSAITKQNVAGIVAHEMAHMWFGDLVTMAWWNDLWLNESFASWMGDKSVDFAFPDWDVWTQFVSSDTNSGLSLDGLRNSHPIEQAVNNPSEIGQLFDAISYSKGGSILRMLEQFLGPDIFQEGIAAYISKHQYGNARTEDLWDSLEKVSDQPVKDLMNSWVRQTGYPIIEVSSTRNCEGVSVTAHQRRFFYEHVVDTNTNNDQTIWIVPISAKTATTANKSHLMKERSSNIQLTKKSLKPGEDWVKMNPDQTGFYRTNYDQNDWNRLKHAVDKLNLSPKMLSPVDRLGLQNDAYALGRAGYLPITQFLSLTEAYRSEPAAPVWQDLSSNLSSLEKLLVGEPFLPNYQEFCRNLFQNAAKRSGWYAKPGEGHLDKLFRSTVLNEFGGYGDQPTLDEALHQFARLIDGKKVDPNIRTVVLNLAAKKGDQSTFNDLWALHNAANMEEERVRILSALTHMDVPELLQDTLDLSLTDEVGIHNTVRVIANIASNLNGGQLAWEFLKSNWTELDRRYGDGGFALMNLVSIAGRFKSEESLSDVQMFFANNPVPGADRTIDQVLERIKLNISFIYNNRTDLAHFFGD